MESLEFSVDHELRLTSVNEALAKLCPATVEHLGHSPYFDVLPRIIFSEQDVLRMVLQNGRALHLPEVDFPSFCGTTQAEVEVKPLGDCGSICGAQVRVQRKTTCAMVERLNQFEHLIDIGKQASSLAHGVRNPLNAIKGAVVYLQRRYAHESDLLEFTGIMQDEITRLDRFITDFLSASLDGSDRVPTDLNALLQRAQRIVSLQAQTAGVVIACDCQPLPLLPLNIFQVEQAILNLLNNALSVLGPGGRIQMSSSLLVDDQTVTVKISDTGPGLPEQETDPLSYPQNDRAETKGRGFGLFLSREVMQHHGGTLEIQSSPESGAVITLSFPVPADSI
ncbi:two-component system sensor histidine kinase NtrB [Trichloromonas sp.]|uniref:two-component system sensor histidine kinase NtrB n=1 Tax=Trichloromonas sp. TaxID=3069249 RepID=UPI003D81A98A